MIDLAINHIRGRVAKIKSTKQLTAQYGMTIIWWIFLLESIKACLFITAIGVLAGIFVIVQVRAALPAYMANSFIFDLLSYALLPFFFAVSFLYLAYYIIMLQITIWRLFLKFEMWALGKLDLFLWKKTGKDAPIASFLASLQAKAAKNRDKPRSWKDKMFSYGFIAALLGTYLYFKLPEMLASIDKIMKAGT